VGYVESPSAVFFGTGQRGRFTRVNFGDDKGTAYGLAIADLDGNKQLDIAAARPGAPNMVYFGGARGPMTRSDRSRELPATGIRGWQAGSPQTPLVG